ncbi:YbhB/YbcL family Raf kinase inhibitor-like protein [Streptomyces violaceusniger]|uniref:YbhB/YbcL family Raf kinase inhibitor-like protein n=1 Tax=Streptomyces violaceusniger TaxID=68280 RepID=UPI00342540ED
MTLPNDAGYSRYLGPATPPGNGPDRYFLVVHAVGVEELEVSDRSTPAYLDFLLFSHAIARATMYGTFERAWLRCSERWRVSRGMSGHTNSPIAANSCTGARFCPGAVALPTTAN